jgi:hypothetical protein
MKIEPYAPDIEDLVDAEDLPEECEASIENLRLIASSHSCRTFVWGKTKKEKKNSRLLIDAQTANLGIMVYDRLNEANKRKAEAMLAKSNSTANRFFNICWGLVK